MATVVLVHGEFEGPRLTWWAEAPDLPGFSAAADTLRELRGLAREGIEDFLRVREPATVEIEWRLASLEASRGPEIDLDALVPHSEGPEVVGLSSVV